MTATAPTVTTIPAWVEIAAIDDFVPCEARHGYTSCSGAAVWRAPAFPCGCRPAINACQSEHDYVFGVQTPNIRCADCRHAAPISEWRKGWYRL